jgi:hypothetical protein
MFVAPEMGSEFDGRFNLFCLPKKSAIVTTQPLVYLEFNLSREVKAVDRLGFIAFLLQIRVDRGFNRFYTIRRKVVSAGVN